MTGFYEEIDQVGKKAFERGAEEMKKVILDILSNNKFKMHDTQLNHDVEEAIDIDVIKQIEQL